MLRPYRTLFVALCVACFCQCSSTGAASADFPLQTTDQVEIAYAQEGGASLRLCSAALMPLESTYSKTGNDTNLKVASDDDLRRLLAGLSALEFFDSAEATPRSNAKATLTVRINDRTWARSRLPVAASSVEEVKRFHDCVAAFHWIYNETRAYHSAAGVDAKDLKAQNRRVRSAAEKARDRQ